MHARGFLLLAIVVSSQAQDRALDRLLTGPERSDLKWAVTVPQPVLSNFQRLFTRISIRVDGKEIARRNGKGEFRFIARFTGAAGDPHWTQTRVDLENYRSATASHELECSVQAFILPGDYRVSIAAIDPASGEASVVHRTLHVAPLGNDPLPDAWKKMPPVEFIDVPEAPDRWFLPEERGQMFLPVQNEQPVRIELLANVSPTEMSRRQGRAYGRSMDSIIPALKILSEMELRNGSKNLSLIDVGRRRVSYEQRALKRVDWLAMKSALESDNPNKIDAESLRDRGQNAQFFIDQALRRTAADGDLRPVLIVLTAPASFSSRQEMRPVERSKGLVFYLRFQIVIPSAIIANQQPLDRGGSIPEAAAMPRLLIDQLEHTLKPLQPHLFDIYTPADFRKALAAILREIAR